MSVITSNLNQDNFPSFKYTLEKEIKLEKDFFYNMRNPLTSQRLEEIRKTALMMKKSEKYGFFEDYEHYLESVNLLIKSTLETRHRNYILLKKILPEVRNFNNFLDVGIGNGDLTRFLGKNFNHITAVDINKNSLEKLSQTNVMRRKDLNTINKSISDINFFEKYYDFALLSHVLYYLPSNQWLSITRKIYNALSDQGHLVIVINEGGDRQKIIENFGGVPIRTKNFIQEIHEIFEDVKIFNVNELSTTKDLNSMLHIIGVCLHECNIWADSKKLENYVINNLYKKDNFFTCSMVQRIIVVSKTKNF